jgi:alkylated DNA repair dioxygenase AlkB
MNSQLDLFQTKKNIKSEKDYDKILGLQLIPNFITREEELTMLKFIDSQVWMNDLKRRVQHYGFKYDYRLRRIDYTMRVGDLPNWLVPLSIRLQKEAIFIDMPDQVIVNEYEKGQGISPHIDCEPCFEDTIVSLSLNSTAIMEFTNDTTAKKIPVLLEPRSLVVLKGESRYDWLHSIPARQKDVYEGITHIRKRRVSLTFRKVII